MSVCVQEEEDMRNQTVGLYLLLSDRHTSISHCNWNPLSFNQLVTFPFIICQCVATTELHHIIVIMIIIITLHPQLSLNHIHRDIDRELKVSASISMWPSKGDVLGLCCFWCSSLNTCSELVATQIAHPLTPARSPTKW